MEDANDVEKNLIIFEISNKFNLLKEQTINYLLKSLNIAIEGNTKEDIIMKVIEYLHRLNKDNLDHLNKILDTNIKINCSLDKIEETETLKKMKCLFHQLIQI